MSDPLPLISIYTDGGADPNPGPGGWGAVLIHPLKEMELSGGEADTTNNRMELTAALMALRALKQPCEIHFYTDSEYLRQGITEWLAGWEANDWQRGKQAVKNADIWQQLAQAIKPHQIHWHWVRGHTGDTYNERAHQLASAAIPRAESVSDTQRTQVYLRISGPPTGGEGPGGWAAAVVRGEDVQILSGGRRKISPNHLALVAAIEAIRQLPPEEPLQIFTNNSYLHDGITQWVTGWRKNGWIKPDKFNADWQTLDRLNRERSAAWVRMREEPAIFVSLRETVEAARKHAAEG